MPYTSREVRQLSDLAHIASPDYQTLVEKAWLLAYRVYGKKRMAGALLRDHAFETAKIVAALDLGPTTITAGLLHDALIHGAVSEKEIRKQFGEKTLFRLQALKAVSLARYRESKTHTESMLAFFIAASKDLRVLIIKLAERLARIRIARAVPRRMREHLLKETMAIYVPLAERLNLQPVARELEDRCFKLTDPKVYRLIKREIALREKRDEKALTAFKTELLSTLQEAGIALARLETRIKSAWSTHQKLQKKGATAKVFDVKALRIILATAETCYQALEVIHHRFPPIPGRVKDYIAYPKENGYRSLHTTVLLPDGSSAEIQLRTSEMHESSEVGVAAHEHYKRHNHALITKRIRRFFPPPETSGLVPVSKERLHKVPLFIRELVDGNAYIADPFNASNKSRESFWQRRMFIFDEHDAVIELPAGATVLDFAFAAHPVSAVRLCGVTVNGAHVSLSTLLKNGDRVKLHTRKTAEPSRKWLRAAKTSLARRQIKQALKNLQNA